MSDELKTPSEIVRQAEIEFRSDNFLTQGRASLLLSSSCLIDRRHDNERTRGEAEENLIQHLHYALYGSLRRRWPALRNDIMMNLHPMEYREIEKRINEFSDLLACPRKK